MEPMPTSRQNSACHVHRTTR